MLTSLAIQYTSGPLAHRELFDPLDTIEDLDGERGNANAGSYDTEYFGHV